MELRISSRERLQRACTFWLQSEVAKDVQTPPDFYRRMRSVYLLAGVDDEAVLMIAFELFDGLMLEIRPPQSWFESWKVEQSSWKG